MLPDRVSNPRPLTYESGALPIALRGPAARSGGYDIPFPMVRNAPRFGHGYMLQEMGHMVVHLLLCHALIEAEKELEGILSGLT